MAETTIGDHVYRTGKLHALAQFQVVRRLLPLIGELPEIKTGPDGKPLVEYGKLIGAIASALSSLKDEDCEYVFGECLKVCRRKQGEGWVPVWNTAANRLQFDDIDMMTMLSLTMTTLEENLGSFLPALPSNSLTDNSQPSVG